MPEEATVPRFFSTSSAVMPMPLSDTTSVPFSRFGTIWMRYSESAACDLSVRPSNRERSQASDALESSSRRKTSFLE